MGLSNKSDSLPPKQLPELGVLDRSRVSLELMTSCKLVIGDLPVAF